MTQRNVYGTMWYEYVCDGCKGVMKMSGYNEVPPGWVVGLVDQGRVSLHACLRCDIAPLVAEYERRKKLA